MSQPDWNAIDVAMRARVQSVVRSILRDEHEAEDAVQEAFLRALRNIGSLREPAALPGWLLTLARRAAIDRCRMLRRTPQVSEEVEGALDRRESPPSNVMEIVEAFARLTPQMQRALDQSARGWSLERAAAEEGISLSAAKTRLSRARARLKQLVQL